MVSLEENNVISTTIYEKDSDAFLYLHDESNHPEHVKTKIAYGLALRAKRICTKKQDYEDNAKKIE